MTREPKKPRTKRSVLDGAAAEVRASAGVNDIVNTPTEYDEGSLWLSNLTPKQTHYVKMRAAGYTPSASAEAAYGNPSACTRNESNPVIQAALRSMCQDTQERLNINREHCLRIMAEAVEMARIMSEPTTMIAGAREMAKMCGFYEPERREIAVTDQAGRLLHKVSQLTDSQLTKMLNSPDTSIIDAEYTVQ